MFEYLIGEHGIKFRILEWQGLLEARDYVNAGEWNVVKPDRTRQLVPFASDISDSFSIQDIHGHFPVAKSHLIRSPIIQKVLVPGLIQPIRK